MHGAEEHRTTWNRSDASASLIAESRPLTPHLLVIEDDPDFRRQLADYFGYLGWTTSLAADGDEGVASFQASGADVVLCDINLPRMDGFDTVEAIRLLSGGASVPVVMVSAVWQEPKRFRARLEALNVAEFLRKPLSIVELGRRLAVLPSIPAEALEGAATRSGQFRSGIVDQTLNDESGDVAPVGRYRPCELVSLFARLFLARRSTTVLISDGRIQREVVFVDGYPVQADSTAPEEGLASLLLRNRDLDVGSVPGLLHHARVRSVPLREVLLERKLISEERLLQAERDRVRMVLRACFAAGPGYYETIDGAAPPVGLIEVHPLPFLCSVLDTLVLGDLSNDLADHADKLVLPGPEHARLHAELSLPEQLDWLGPAISSGVKLQRLLDDAGSHADAALRHLWLMLQVGIIATVSDARAPQPGRRMTQHSTRPPSLILESNREVRALSDKARELLGDYVRLIRASHHELLALSQDDEAEAVDLAWRARATAWRPLALDDREPADVRLKARELMARLADARDVLRDPVRRLAYERSLGLAPLPPSETTATETLLVARAAFKSGDWTAAILAFRGVLAKQPRAMEALLGLCESLLEHPDVGVAGRSSVLELLERAEAIAPEEARIDDLRRRVRGG
jgi:CheY-like chemotaxis protein